MLQKKVKYVKHKMALWKNHMSTGTLNSIKSVIDSWDQQRGYDVLSSLGCKGDLAAVRVLSNADALTRRELRCRRREIQPVDLLVHLVKSAFREEVSRSGSICVVVRGGGISLLAALLWPSMLVSRMVMSPARS